MKDADVMLCSLFVIAITIKYAKVDTIYHDYIKPRFHVVGSSSSFMSALVSVCDELEQIRLCRDFPAQLILSLGSVERLSVENTQHENHHLIDF